MYFQELQVSEVLSAATRERRVADNATLGIGLTVVAILIFGLQDALSKLLASDYSPFQLAMMRFWAFAPFSLLLVMRQGPLKQAFRSKFPLLQVLRGVLLIVDIWLFIVALSIVPLPEIQAMILISPLLVTLFAIPILGERVGLFRFVAIGIGLCGALIILRPGGLPLSWGVAATFAASICYALYIVLTRKVSSADSTATSMVYVGVVGLVLTTATGVFFWKPMDLVDLGIISIVMITTIAGHGLTMLALSRVPASTVQPFNYLALPWGIVLGYLVFDDLIDGVSLIGAAVIVGAGLVIMARERRLARTGRASEPQPAEESLPH